VSCGSAGSCSAGGYYQDSSGNQAFVVSEAKGKWGKAEEVPGTAVLNTGGDGFIESVSCGSAGSCSAGGYYAHATGQYEVSSRQAFVVSEVKGKWGRAEEAPGTAALNVRGGAGINSVSCASAGSCSAGGYYQDAASGEQAFVVNEVKGKWGRAEEAPGTAALNAGGSAFISSVSCASAGNCGAGGQYREDASGKLEVFVVSEVKGKWGRAEEVPGTAALNVGGFLGADAQMNSVSCASASSCSAGGYYHDASGDQQAFVVSEGR